MSKCSECICNRCELNNPETEVCSSCYSCDAEGDYAEELGRPEPTKPFKTDCKNFK